MKQKLLLVLQECTIYESILMYTDNNEILWSFMLMERYIILHLILDLLQVKPKTIINWLNSIEKL